VRILYVASDQVVPGATGGSVHVLEVAAGLAAIGHEVHAVVRRQPGQAGREDRDGVAWHRIRWFPPQRAFRWRARPSVERIAADVAPEVVIERYYNFGGEGLAVARRRGLPSLLEVNAPVVDHPRSLKALVDRALLVQPMRRYREGLCAEASALVSPLAEIVPEAVRVKTEVVTWGANVERFRPERRSATTRRELGVPEEAVLVLFSGSFRPWHGVEVLERAARALAHREDVFFVLAGGHACGPARGYRGLGLGPVAYDRMPEITAVADVGVAPYDTRRLGQLRLGFFWSPLKVFEYMASALPTVTIPRAPLTEIVRDGREALFFREGDGQDLARVLERLAEDPSLRKRLGQAARERVVSRYSWARHCEQLDGVIRRIAS
jgi:glycosyltransferase involved in cell wall biosynthesis